MIICLNSPSAFSFRCFAPSRENHPLSNILFLHLLLVHAKARRREVLVIIDYASDTFFEHAEAKDI